jgi:DeoR/GlpR family transcriptional regulator of sugar metabolism
MSQAETPSARREAIGLRLDEGHAVSAMRLAEEFGVSEDASTNLALVPLLAEDRELTVVTNSVPIAAAVLKRQDLRLVMIGGEVDLLVGGCVDAFAVAQIADMRFDRCFLGACALSARDGVTIHGHADAQFKRTVLQRSRDTTILLTNDKLGQVTHHRIAAPDGVGTIILEADAPDDAVAAVTKAGGSIVRAGWPCNSAA